MKNFYVIGNPIKHSLSPIIFNYWFKKYKISKTYKKKSIEINFFNKRFEKMINSKSFGGANITIPFKEKAIDHVDVVDAHSKKIGAINCIYKKKSKIYGTNTDWVGFYKLIKPYFKKNPTKKKSVAILGYGGSAKAVIYSLKKTGFKKIYIYVRNKKKVRKNENKKNMTNIFNLSKINQKTKIFDLIINTTPAKSLKDLKINLAKAKKNTVVVDLNYYKHKTNFIKEALKNKLKVLFGIEMLILQAAPAFKIWFGIEPHATEKLLQICEKKLKK